MSTALYAMATGRVDGPLHAVAVHGPNPAPPSPGLSYRSVCGVVTSGPAGLWEPESGAGHWCKVCQRYLRVDGPPADPRVVDRAKNIHADAMTAGNPIPLKEAVVLAREQIAAEDAGHDAQPQRIGQPIPEGCAEPSASQRETEAALLDCPTPSKRGMARHEALAPKIREAVREVLAGVRLDLPENPTVQEISRRASKGWRLRETEIDMLIDRITRAVGEVLVGELGP